jgi:hypothetical protein
MSNTVSEMDGYDPLSLDVSDPETTKMLDDQNRRIVNNILKSYTGYFDLFAEPLQNALDAVEARAREGNANYQPKVFVEIDIQSSRLRVVDNGIGMSPHQLRYFVKPNVSFKKPKEYRGQKGVGATFLAYGYSLLRIHTRQAGIEQAVNLRQGRLWAACPHPCKYSNLSSAPIGATSASIRRFVARRSSCSAVDNKSDPPHVGMFSFCSCLFAPPMLRARLPLRGRPVNEMNSRKVFDRDAGAGPVDPMALMNEMLIAHAISLDTMFAGLVEDAANSRPYEESLETYTRLALRAQANCRASLEAIARADDRAARRALREAKK